MWIEWWKHIPEHTHTLSLAYNIHATHSIFAHCKFDKRKVTCKCNNKFTMACKFIQHALHMLVEMERDVYALFQTAVANMILPEIFMFLFSTHSKIKETLELDMCMPKTNETCSLQVNFSFILPVCIFLAFPLKYKYLHMASILKLLSIWVHWIKLAGTHKKIQTINGALEHMCEVRCFDVLTKLIYCVHNTSICMVKYCYSISCCCSSGNRIQKKLC